MTAVEGRNIVQNCEYMKQQMRHKNMKLFTMAPSLETIVQVVFMKTGFQKSKYRDTNMVIRSLLFILQLSISSHMILVLELKILTWPLLLTVTLLSVSACLGSLTLSRFFLWEITFHFLPLLAIWRERGA